MGPNPSQPDHAVRRRGVVVSEEKMAISDPRVEDGPVRLDAPDL